MVVDIRYHLASLVAVFFALGLGILVGTSISSGEAGIEAREQWLSAVERELKALRMERQEIQAELERAISERELYRAFADELVDAVIEGALAGKEFAVVSLGDGSGAVGRASAVLERAGAAVVRRELGREKAAHGAAAWEGGSLPRHVIAVLDGSPQHYRASLETLVDQVAAAGGAVTAAVGDPAGWRAVLEALDMPYISEWDTPPGRLSLVLLLASGERGRYGAAGELFTWPRHLLAPRFLEQKSVERKVDQP